MLCTTFLHLLIIRNATSGNISGRFEIEYKHVPEGYVSHLPNKKFCGDCAWLDALNSLSRDYA